MTALALPLSCSSCTGVAAYRVRFAQMAAAEDNFDQLVDHLPMLFTSSMFLESTAANRSGQVTVWRLGDGTPDQPDTVIAYSGPDPNTGGRTWWCESGASS